MPPKRIPVNANTKIPDFLKAKAKKKPTAENELEKLLTMSNAEMFPYICFATVVVLLFVYNLVPSVFKYLVEFQYPLVADEPKDDTGAVILGKEKRPTVQYFETGLLDASHLMFLFLCVESFEVFVSELLQGAAKYLLKAPKATQEVFVSNGISFTFHALSLFTGFGLIPGDFWMSSGSFWAGIDNPITRTQKFYLLIQIAFQATLIANYLINVPQKSWKLLTIVGSAIGLLTTLVGYFSGFYVATTVVLIAYDLSAVLYEIKLLLDCLFFLKPETSPGHQLVLPVQIFWVVNRIVVVLLLIVAYWTSDLKNSVTGEPLEVPLLLIGSAFALIGVQALWFGDVTKKLTKAIESNSE